MEVSPLGPRRPRAPTITIDTSGAGHRYSDTLPSVATSLQKPPPPHSRTRRNTLGSPEAQDALKAHSGTKGDFQVENNKFAFSPGQLGKLYNPKNLSAFHALRWVERLGEVRRTDEKDEGFQDHRTRPEPATTRLEEFSAQLRLPKEKAKRGLFQQASSKMENNTRTVFEIPGSIQGIHKVEAIGDSCAKLNFIRESYARTLPLFIDRSTTRSIAITRTQHVKTSGVVCATFGFAGEVEMHPLRFHLLPDCQHNVVLGKSFLKLTKTFSDARNLLSRVKERVVQTLERYNLCYLGDSTPKFTGLLNGRPREALGDSGSQGNFMSKAFTGSMKFSITHDPEYRFIVQFADGSTAKTMGMVHGVKWQFGLTGTGTEHSLDFHVLEDSPADVILSDAFLYKTRAFAVYDRYLIDEGGDEDDNEDGNEDDDAYLLAITLRRERCNQVRIARAIDLARHQEVQLMMREEDEILNLPAEHRYAERQKMLEKRVERQHKQAMMQHQSCPVSGLCPPAQSSVAPPLAPLLPTSSESKNIPPWPGTSPQSAAQSSSVTTSHVNIHHIGTSGSPSTSPASNTASIPDATTTGPGVNSSSVQQSSPSSLHRGRWRSRLYRKLKGSKDVKS